MSDLPKPMREVNRQNLAILCNVSLPVVDKWIADGCPFVDRGSKGIPWRFDIARVFEWRIERRAAEVSAAFTGEGGLVSRDEADRRRALAQAIVAELDADDRLNTTVNRDDMLEDVAGFCHVLHSGLGNAASRIAARAATMASPAEIEDLAKSEMNRAFEAAEVELDQRWSTTPKTAAED